MIGIYLVRQCHDHQGSAFSSFWFTFLALACVVALGLLAPQNHSVNLFPNLPCMQGNWPLQFIFPWFLKSLAST